MDWPSIILALATFLTALGGFVVVLRGRTVQEKIHKAVNSNHTAAVARIEAQAAKLDRLEQIIVDLTGKSSNKQ